MRTLRAWIVGATAGLLASPSVASALPQCITEVDDISVLGWSPDGDQVAVRRTTSSNCSWLPLREAIEVYEFGSPEPVRCLDARKPEGARELACEDIPSYDVENWGAIPDTALPPWLGPPEGVDTPSSYVPARAMALWAQTSGGHLLELYGATRTDAQRVPASATSVRVAVGPKRRHAVFIMTQYGVDDEETYSTEWMAFREVTPSVPVERGGPSTVGVVTLDCEEAGTEDSRRVRRAVAKAKVLARVGEIGPAVHIGWGLLGSVPGLPAVWTAHLELALDVGLRTRARAMERRLAKACPSVHAAAVDEELEDRLRERRSR